MDDLNTALNTYMLLILNLDLDDIIVNHSHGDVASFYIDPQKEWEDPLELVSDIFFALVSTLEVLEENEHYEKCHDINEQLKEMYDKL